MPSMPQHTGNCTGGEGGTESNVSRMGGDCGCNKKYRNSGGLHGEGRGLEKEE